jgi:tRNA A37 methylthiotransferase MiaB
MKEYKKKFRRPDICRPPSEQNSYFLPLTAGCSNNKCTFCSYYGKQLQMRDYEEVKKEIDALALLIEHGTILADVDQIVYMFVQHWDGRRIFLQDSDALVYPYPKLIDILEHLNKKLPDIERIGIYATSQDILRKVWKSLRN